MRSVCSASVCTIQTRKHYIDSLPLVACEIHIPTIKVKALLCFDNLCVCPPEMFI